MKTIVEYELLKLRNDAELARLWRRAAWQERVYLLAGVVIVLVLGWAVVKGGSL